MDDLHAEIQRDLGLRLRIWNALRRAPRAKRNKRPLIDCLTLAYDAFAQNLERAGKLTMERVDGILPVLCAWLDRAGWPRPPILGAQPTRRIRYRFDLMEADGSTTAELRPSADQTDRVSLKQSWTVEVLEGLLSHHVACWKARVQLREAEAKPLDAAVDRIRSDSAQKDPAEELSTNPPMRVPEPATAAEPLRIQFPKRAEYLKARMDERKWTARKLEDKGGPDHRYGEKALRGEEVQERVLVSFARGLSAHKGFPAVERWQIPND
jgi:hypothetical protein